MLLSIEAWGAFTGWILVQNIITLTGNLLARSTKTTGEKATETSGLMFPRT